MTDVHSSETRHYNMSRIKGKDTKPELIVRKYLFGKGFRYRLNVKGLPGKPDLVLPKYRTVIFIHGCFWHGHENCKYFVIPKTRTAWWTEKIGKNKERDQRTHASLRETGWNIMTVWECQLKPQKRQETLEGIVTLLEKLWLDSNKKQYLTDKIINLAAETEVPYGQG